VATSGGLDASLGASGRPDQLILSPCSQPPLVPNDSLRLGSL
jgi:hypothetical protein